MRKEEIIERMIIVPSRGDGWVFTAERDIRVSKEFIGMYKPKPGDVYVEEMTVTGLATFTEPPH